MRPDCQKCPSEIEQVISNGFCIGCGSCAAYDYAFSIEENGIGQYTATVQGTPKLDTSEVCPFAARENEDSISKRLFSQDNNYDPRIGYFKGVYSGYVCDQQLRRKSSSGGIVTWILKSLMRNRMIDGVVHVGATGLRGDLFAYRISRTEEDLENNTGSRYYPVHFDEVIARIGANHSGRYAFVGVPCFVKAVRLLAEKDPNVKAMVKYCVAIFCGHLKSKGFAEMIAWQVGSAPGDLAGIDFRVKLAGRSANQYAVAVLGASGCSKEIKSFGPVPTRDLYGMDWGLGYFKPRACDWCDDIAGETADIACGDAWLPEFVADPLGTSIVVVRNADLYALLTIGMDSGVIALQEQAADRVFESQAGNYRHRREGLSVRIERAEGAARWHPTKRVALGDFSVPADRREIYVQREKLAAVSHFAFREAKNRGSFPYFVFSMLPHEIKYYRLNRRLLRSFAKHIFLLLRHFSRIAK
mgnify:FL=1